MPTRGAGSGAQEMETAHENPQECTWQTIIAHHEVVAEELEAARVILRP